MAVIWKDPRPSVWEGRLGPLLERPGVWALVHKTGTPEGAYVLCAQLRAGQLKVPEVEGAWEFVGQKVPSGGEVYARYLAPDPEAVA